MTHEKNLSEIQTKNHPVLINVMAIDNPPVPTIPAPDFPNAVLLDQTDDLQGGVWIVPVETSYRLLLKGIPLAVSTPDGLYEPDDVVYLARLQFVHVLHAPITARAIVEAWGSMQCRTEAERQLAQQFCAFRDRAA